jgi:CBS domain-containing protein
MRGITLFIFGGVAEMSNEPPGPKEEFLMAVAGPVASVVTAGVAYGALLAGRGLGWPETVTAVLGYLAVINLALVAFNVMPAFPLDGGRMLRAALWRWKGNLRWATRISSTIGGGFGAVLIGLGLLSLLVGNIVGGIWWILIGFFVRQAAQGSYRQLLMRRSLEGEPVRRFMKTDPVTVRRDLSIREVVEDYVYRHHYKMLPVVAHGELVGCVTTRRIKETPRDEWERQSVGSIVEPCSEENSISPDADAMEALSRMHRSRASRLMVVEDGTLVGVLSLKDLLEFFSLKMELGDG